MIQFYSRNEIGFISRTPHRGRKATLIIVFDPGKWNYFLYKTSYNRYILYMGDLEEVESSLEIETSHLTLVESNTIEFFKCTNFEDAFPELKDLNLTGFELDFKFLKLEF